jgi:transporter family-2 protein
VTHLYTLVAIVTGVGLAVQAVVNSRLRFILGTPLWAAAAQFIVGLALIIAVAVLTRQPMPTTGGVLRAPWWIWSGGVFGATYIVMSIVLTPRLGAALMLASTIVGQLAAALIVDHYGWFGATVIPVTMTRVLGVALLALGVILIRWT